MKKCPYCAEEIQDDAVKCKHCGEFLNPEAARGTGPASTGPQKKLTRSATNRQISGVCAGLAEYTGMDPTLMRILFVLATLATGLVPGLIAYVVLAMVMPEA